MSEEIVVVGGGIGGLTCAINLAARGEHVRILEKQPYLGGKARRVFAGEAGMDGGPTVLTMLWVFDELFDLAGHNFRDSLPLERAERLARHRWSSGQELDLFADKQRSADAIAEVFGAREGRAYLAFSDDARKIFELSENAFLRSQRMGLTGMVREFGARGLSALARLDSHRSMWGSLQKRFREPKLWQLFGRYATYVGSSPFETPATLNQVAHVEADGVYRAKGGMRGLIDALVDLAKSVGVKVELGVDVKGIAVRGGRVKGVETAGAFREAKAVVFNGDISAVGTGLLGGAAKGAVKPTPVANRSLSAVTWAMDARAEGMDLVHHNVIFCDDYEAEFRALIGRSRVPDEPTVYICAQDRGDAPIAAKSERMLVLVNAPPTGDRPERWPEKEKERCTEAMTRVLRKSGLTLHPRASSQTSPLEFAKLFPATGGALYGPRWRGARSVMARKGAATGVEGLYMAGGSVHPGPGVAMVALSGRRAAERVYADLPSTQRSRQAATFGTTSTA
ncbi:MAG: phytoene desaturase family protein [Myxococcota bacterium]